MLHIIGDIIWGAFVISIFLGSAIFVHELGHFLMARWRGVAVDAFAIGMGPKIVAYTAKNGTEYSLRWLPVGGFVKLHKMVRSEAEEEEREDALKAMSEEEEGEGGAAMPTGEPALAVAGAGPVPGKKSAVASLGESAHEDLGALYDKGLVTKLLVFGGGVFFNFLTAIAALTLLFTMGRHVDLAPKGYVSELEETSPLYQAGLRQGDLIFEVEGKKVEFVDETQEAIIAASKDGSSKDGLDIKATRAGAEMALKLPPVEKPIDSPEDLKEGSYEFALLSAPSDFPPYIRNVVPFGPAHKAGMKDGDFILQVNNKPVTTWGEMAKIVRRNPNEAVSLLVERKDAKAPIEIVIVCEEDTEEKGVGRAGIMSGSGRQELVKEPFFTALANAPLRAVSIFADQAQTNYTVLTKYSLKGIKKNLGGPVAIGTMIIHQAHAGFEQLLWFFIMMNIILAFMNILPIPVLDGGFIVLSVIEAAIRRPVPERVLGPIYTVFVLMLMGLFLFITYNDLLRFL